MERNADLPCVSLGGTNFFCFILLAVAVAAAFASEWLLLLIGGEVYKIMDSIIKAEEGRNEINRSGQSTDSSLFIHFWTLLTDDERVLRGGINISSPYSAPYSDNNNKYP